MGRGAVLRYSNGGSMSNIDSDSVYELKPWLADGQPRFVCPIYSIWVTEQKCKEAPCKGFKGGSVYDLSRPECPFTATTL